MENLAFKKIHTRSHPVPDPPEVVSDPEKLLRKKRFEEGEASNNPLERSYTLLDSIVTVEDIDYDLPFGQSIFRSKSKSFVCKTIIDESKIKPYIPSQNIGVSKSDRDILQQFYKLEHLVNQLHEADKKSPIFQ